MGRPEDLTRVAPVKGILLDGLLTAVNVKWYGSAVVELIYKDAIRRWQEQDPAGRSPEVLRKGVGP